MMDPQDLIQSRVRLDSACEPSRSGKLGFLSPPPLSLSFSCASLGQRVQRVTMGLLDRCGALASDGRRVLLHFLTLQRV